MNFQPINPPLYPGQYVYCAICGRAITDRHLDAVADLDGEPFAAYYHAGTCVGFLKARLEGEK